MLVLYLFHPKGKMAKKSTHISKSIHHPLPSQDSPEGETRADGAAGGGSDPSATTSGTPSDGGGVLEPISHSKSWYTCRILTPLPCRPAMYISMELWAVTPTAMGALFSVVFTATGKPFSKRPYDFGLI